MCGCEVKKDEEKKQPKLIKCCRTLPVELYLSYLQIAALCCVMVRIQWPQLDQVQPPRADKKSNIIESNEDSVL